MEDEVCQITSQNCSSRLKLTFRTNLVVVTPPYVTLRSAAPELQTAPDFSTPSTCTLHTVKKTKTQTSHTKPAHVTSFHHLHDQICHVYNAVRSTKTVWHSVKCLTIKTIVNRSHMLDGVPVSVWHTAARLPRCHNSVFPFTASHITPKKLRRVLATWQLGAQATIAPSLSSNSKMAFKIRVCY